MIDLEFTLYCMLYRKKGDFIVSKNVMLLTGAGQNR